jgi:predicted ATPase/class 3 adenylate cyclase
MIRRAMRRDLPTGTVTFLFTDVEGSTKLLEAIGDEAYEQAVGEHRRLVREACAAHSGVEVDTQGDAFFFAFPSAPEALAAATEMTSALASGPIRVRVGLHTGEPRIGEEGYVGKEVHFAARVASSGHGGQIVLSQATAQLAASYELTDLGEQRLKDIEGPVEIFQLGAERFPPLKTISNTNLPRPASSFVGRETELGEVLGKLEQGARLLTLTGPGGSGKTRLALEAAATLVPEYKAGVFWVGLASLRDASLVTEQISQTLGAKDGLAGHVSEREMLLLLDNLEQVIDVAPELSVLLSSCPNLALLCTSRELLRIQGEVEYAVPPLASEEALSLFCERSRLDPSEEISELCARLDNLPLAVELAAARTKALTPAQILERLSSRLDLLKGGRDADPRQQTLRATIAWSYDLLPDEEQRLFRCLSVFSGGCTLEAAQEVADADLDTLQSLVEKSLLRFTNSRYWMLEMIREFAGERLQETPDPGDAASRHAAYFAVLAEDAEPNVKAGPEQSAWLERLEHERDNMRAALGWASDRDVELGLRLCAALAGFWDLHGPITEARMWFNSLLERESATPVELQAKVLPWATDWAMMQGDYGEAQAFGEASLRVARELGNPMAVGQAFHDLAEVATGRGEYPRARELYEQAIAAAAEVGYPAPGSIANLGALALLELDLARARDLLSRALVLFREQGKAAGAAMALQQLATVERRSGDYPAALSFIEESAELSRQLGYEEVTAWCLFELAALLAEHEEGQEAARALGTSEALLERLGIGLSPKDVEYRADVVDAIHGLIGEEAQAESLARGRRTSIEDALTRALPRAREALTP